MDQPEGFCAGHTERVAARELRFLRVLRGQFVANAVEELDVALLGILFESSDKGPRHGTGSLRSDGSIGTITRLVLRPKDSVGGER
jgi:hypothetical protein